MKILTKQYKVYFFKELSIEAKENVLQNQYDINVDYEWWDHIFDDAEQIGCKILEFDDHNCKLEFIDFSDEIAYKIIETHGFTCETHKTAKDFLKKYSKLSTKYCDEADELIEEFNQSLSEDYRIILRKEYEYLTSEESIIETIEANEYEFLENGKMDIK